jgi:hypothetical protein
MRIVIDIEEPDEGRGRAMTAATERAPVVLDGGPAPAALLRRFGRIPELPPESAETRGDIERPDDSEGGEMAPNPLRYGESIATQRQSNEREQAVAPEGREGESS